MFLLTVTVSCLVGFVSAQFDPNCAEGRQVAVHLFEWKWTSIASECESFLGPNGFCAVQVSPPNEHRVILNPPHPWWERYQPVSFILGSRSGNEQEFIDMVKRCNNVGVRIYVDAVINHMGGGGTGKGSAGSYYDASKLQFPGVPYGPQDFNSKSKCGTSSGSIENWQDKWQVRYCGLVGLPDLNVESDYVRRKIQDYLNHLIDIGVAGFRVDASKHMYPEDERKIFDPLKPLNEKYFSPNSKAFIYQEVIDFGGEAISSTEYTGVGRVTEFKYGKKLSDGIRGHDKLKWYFNFGEGWGMLPSGKAVVFIDNHDSQRGGHSVINFFEPRLYKMANAFMLAHPYGFTRLMSSYRWTRNWVDGRDTNDWMGPLSNSDGVPADVIINSDGLCANGWVCEHRWRQIKNMVAFRNKVTGTSLNDWWDNGNQQVAFGRGDKGFIAINNDGNLMSATLQTGMEPGQYCDVISGDFDGKQCSGKVIVVNANRKISISIANTDDDPMIAIHAGAKVKEVIDITTTPPSPTTTPPTSTWKRTVVLIHKVTVPGQAVFIRGGISHSKRHGCTQDALTSSCAIPIKYKDIGSSGHYAQYNAWKEGDTRLDWYGKQTGQGTFNGAPAEGSPMVWTSNAPQSSGYQSANKYGEHYWMFDVDMDCSKTQSGWFELKAYLSNGVGWENNIIQVSSCGGAVGGVKAYSSQNHMARCGFVNVFKFNSGSCIIEAI